MTKKHLIIIGAAIAVAMAGIGVRAWLIDQTPTTQVHTSQTQTITEALVPNTQKLVAATTADPIALATQTANDISTADVDISQFAGNHTNPENPGRFIDFSKGIPPAVMTALLSKVNGDPEQINSYEKQQQVFESLPDNVVKQLLEDPSVQAWVSTQTVDVDQNKPSM